MSVTDPPKSILKKKSQFDREVDSYLRVKPVKSIRFSLDSNKVCSRSSPTSSNISLDPKIIKNKRNQNKNEKKRRHRNDPNPNAGEKTDPLPNQNIDKNRKLKKNFLEGHGDEKVKTKSQTEKIKEEAQPEGNKGDSLVVRSAEKTKKDKEEKSEEVKQTVEEKLKEEEEIEKKVTKKRRRRRRRKQKREPKE